MLGDNVEGGRRACPPRRGDGEARLVAEGSPARIEGAVEGGEDPPARMGVVDRRAEDKAVALRGLFDEGVDAVVVKDAAALAEFRAAAAPGAVAERAVQVQPAVRELPFTSNTFINKFLLGILMAVQSAPAPYSRMQARNSSPYRSALTAPTPETRRNSAIERGFLAAMSERAALEKMM